MIVDTAASILSCAVISFTDCRAASSFSLAFANRWNFAALTYVLGLLNAYFEKHVKTQTRQHCAEQVMLLGQ